MHDKLLEASAREFELYVQSLDNAKPDCTGQISVRTPWCDDYTIFTPGIPALKFKIRAALNARSWFSQTGPDWAQPLPLNAREYNVMMRCGGPWYLLAGYSFSLENLDYNFLVHPSFVDYASGVMADDGTPERVRSDPELLAEFPPQPLPGLHRLMWHPPARVCGH